MATENTMLRDGSMVSTGDLRNSTLTGTTLGGPNGSGQFLAMKISTSADRTVVPTTATGQAIFGILQNKPGINDAADICWGGVSKVVSASTAIAAGMDLMVTSTTQGAMIPYSSAAGQVRCARSIEAAVTVGAVFSAYIFGAGAPGGSIA